MRTSLVGLRGQGKGPRDQPYFPGVELLIQVSWLHLNWINTLTLGVFVVATFISALFLRRFYTYSTRKENVERTSPTPMDIAGAGIQRAPDRKD